jgi:hypothetical protein
MKPYICGMVVQKIGTTRVGLFVDYEFADSEADARKVFEKDHETVNKNFNNEYRIVDIEVKEIDQKFFDLCKAHEEIEKI